MYFMMRSWSKFGWLVTLVKVWITTLTSLRNASVTFQTDDVTDVVPQLVLYIVA